MSEKKSIYIAAGLGAVVLALVLLVMRPFSRFENQYPMTVASGGAAAVSEQAVETGNNAPTSTTDPETEQKPMSVTGIPLV
ncbi:MAG: hypothetical protein IJL75_05455, partial [Eubacterium sp.]|nr:hypothetical protein [Eubacterium sp.]